MADNPFFNANLLALGGQMAQAWQQTLESWWDGLLGDRERLRALAEQLAAVRGVEREPDGAAPDDLRRIVEALELIGARQERLEARHEVLEEKIQALTEHVASVVTVLEQMSSSDEGPRGTTPDGGDS